MEKVYILDTNVLMHDADAIESFGDNMVVIPYWVVEELDKHKISPNGKGVAARAAVRNLERYRDTGSLNFAKGVRTASGGTVIVDHRGNPNKLPGKGKIPKSSVVGADNRILALAHYWEREEEEKNRKERKRRPVILVTKDIAMRVMADACKITVQDYQHDKQIASPEELYSGYFEIEIDPRDGDFISSFHREQGKRGSGNVYVHEDEVWLRAEPLNIPPNACCCIKVTGSERKRAYAIYEAKDKRFRYVHWKKTETRERERAGIHPLNAEQALLDALLHDSNLPLVTIAGVAGTGKTLMALKAALDSLERNECERVTVYRPNKELGEKLGFLPGTIEEKFGPWMKPILKLCERILQFSDGERRQNHGEGMNGHLYPHTEKLMAQGRLEILPINYLRGDTLAGEIVIVDEAQNLTPSQGKTALTRAGHGSRFFLTGDIYQIDDPFLDSLSNGLSYVVERFRGHESFGHLTLRHSERSNLAALASQLL